MLITDKKELKNYYSQYRLWQGIPGIEVTKKGRIFSAFYSGGIDEEIGNYVVLLKSDDGENFGEPVLVVYKENARCFDECLWIDPLGRLWLFWAECPDCGTYASVCDDPDAEELVWSDTIFVGNDVMMNKPIVLSTGEWILPIAVWGERIRRWQPERASKEMEFGSFVYQSCDNGKSFQKLGGISLPDCSFDEHMVIELKDGRLLMLIRTMNGIGTAYSYDYGKTWMSDEEDRLDGPNSRFYIGRLKSGRILLINHDNFRDSEDNHQKRNNLTAMISDDECRTWKYKLMLDERNMVSYPDAVEAEDGFIYITYDRDRGTPNKSIEGAYKCEREVLYAKVTEEEIMAGKITNPESKLKCIISKLGKYEGETDPYKNPPRNLEYAQYCARDGLSEGLKRVFGKKYVEKCELTLEQHRRIDEIIDGLTEKSDLTKAFHEIMEIFYYASRGDRFMMIDKGRRAILDLLPKRPTLEEIAEKAGISKYLFKYSFEKLSGLTLDSYIDLLQEKKDGEKVLL